jgi:hypothetical protein
MSSTKRQKKKKNKVMQLVIEVGFELRSNVDPIFFPLSLTAHK